MSGLVLCRILVRLGSVSAGFFCVRTLFVQTFSGRGLVHVGSLRIWASFVWVPCLLRPRLAAFLVSLSPLCVDFFCALSLACANPLAGEALLVQIISGQVLRVQISGVSGSCLWGPFGRGPCLLDSARAWAFFSRFFQSLVPSV